MPFCANCGSQLLMTARFCRECGTKVEAPPSPQTSRPSSTEPLSQNVLLPVVPGTPPVLPEPVVAPLAAEQRIETSTLLPSATAALSAEPPPAESDVPISLDPILSRTNPGTIPPPEIGATSAVDTKAAIEQVETARSDSPVTRPDNSNVPRQGAGYPARLRWRPIFKSEDHVIALFPGMVTKLLDDVRDADSVLARDISSLRFALTKRQEFISGSVQVGNSNVFLAPGAMGAAGVANYLLERRGRYAEAFVAANIFGEMCKIPLQRSREKYLTVFEQLLQTASRALAGYWLMNHQRPSISAREGEIVVLQRALDQDCLRQVFSTYFSSGKGFFLPSKQLDQPLIDRIIRETLASYFDQRLRSLLQNDRPRVKDFVTLNLPVVYRLDVKGTLTARRRQWEQLLQETGFDDVIRFLREMGDLVSAADVGFVPEERRADVRRARTTNDMEQICQLLKESETELRNYLYKEANRLLDYRAPKPPRLVGLPLKDFEKAKRMSETNDPDRLKNAQELIESLWKTDIDNDELREWTAYLRSKTGNPSAAEKMFEQLESRLPPDRLFATAWNLSVLAYNRKDEAGAYKRLLPLLEKHATDADLILVVLGLSLKFNDRERFLATLPHTMNQRFHPLAVVVAHEKGDRPRAEEILGELIQHWQGKWELPPVGDRLNFEELKAIVNKAIVEGQIEQVIAWLRARIVSNGAYVPNYLELSRILEKEEIDPDGAYAVLRDRLNFTRTKRPEPGKVDEACRDLLELCKRTKRIDLGQGAYKLSQDARVSADLLSSFGEFASDAKGDDGDGVRENRGEERDPVGVPAGRPSVPPPILPPTNPDLPQRLAWSTARITGIRNVATYATSGSVISEFCRILDEMYPQESRLVIQLIKEISSVVETFDRTNPDDRDGRRVLYDRALGFERRLTQLLAGDALPPRLIDVVAPYRAAIEQVVGDMSRQSGVGPNVVANIESPFICFGGEAQRTTLVLRVTNDSQRAVTDVNLEIHIDSVQLAVVGRRERRIPSLDPSASSVLAIPLERRGAGPQNGTEVTFGISLRASAEGFPNVDLGILRKQVPIKSFLEATGNDYIPTLFTPGGSLKPEKDPGLFQGRVDLLTRIQRSFHDDTQREKYFLDGIRRVGKTSILNFIPKYLPDSLLPVVITFDEAGQRGPIDSGAMLRSFCNSISEAAEALDKTIPVPPSTDFTADPGGRFKDYLTEFRGALPGKVPFLMIDEFQELLKAVARSRPGVERDTVVLDQLRGHLDSGKLCAIFTGSVRFDRLSHILDHRIFGSLVRLRVSFLSEENTTSVIRAGLGKDANVSPEAVRRIHDLTGGYPWLVHKYGAELVNLLNTESRTVAAPEDIDRITNESIVCSDEYFSHWWPSDQLGLEEELLIETLLRKFSSSPVVSTQEFFSAIPNAQQTAYRKAFDNLRACEVLESTHANLLKFGGGVMRLWLQQHTGPDGRVKIPRATAGGERGQAAFVVDHENLIKSLERIRQARGVAFPPNRLEWFSGILKRLLAEAEKRYGRRVDYRVGVAFWSRPDESALQPAYLQASFDVRAPESVKTENAVDFKVADEVRVAAKKAADLRSKLDRVFLVTGDGDLTHAARALVNEGVTVQIWGGSRSTSQQYRSIVGDENVVALDDIVGM